MINVREIFFYLSFDWIKYKVYLIEDIEKRKKNERNRIYKLLESFLQLKKRRRS